MLSWVNKKPFVTVETSYYPELCLQQERKVTMGKLKRERRDQKRSFDLEVESSKKEQRFPWDFTKTNGFSIASWQFVYYTAGVQK